MERKIGEIFEFGGEWHQCVTKPFPICEDCDLYGVNMHISCIENKCLTANRSDETSVIFKKLEKVGEPYNFQKRTFQTYKLHTIPFLSEDVELVAIPSKDNNTIEIEIKQNKEDMEENKLNLKPFNIQKAREGKPVCTRDGRKVRIICFNRKGGSPVIALVETFVKEYDCIREDSFYYTVEGRAVGQNTESKDDLMMLPERKEGWVNLYKSSAYSTKEEAMKYRNKCNDYIDTIKIEWEE